MSVDKETYMSVNNGEKAGALNLKNFIMAMGIKWKRNWIVLAGIAITALLLYAVSQMSLTSRAKNNLLQFRASKYSVWPEFDHTPSVSSDFFRKHCAGNGDYSITGLVSIKKEWAKKRNSQCQDLYDKFISIFSLEGRKAPLNIPPLFRPKVRGWLGNNEELYQEVFNQNVIHVVSEYTREHTIFNPLRDKRPVLPPEEPEKQYFDNILKETSKNCDFCKYKNFTAEHTFGRVESTYAFSASNIFKVDTLHALLAMKQHDPLHWNLDTFLDLFHLVNTWLKKARTAYPTANYPSAIWDILPKCGASQVHPHLHVVLDFERHHGEVEAWRKGAQDYYNDHKSNYFTDLVSVYSALNLTTTFGKAVAFASLAPKKDHEVVVIAREPDDDFFTLLYIVMRAFIDDLHKMCFSMGMGFPALADPKGKLPAYARIISRGFVTDLRTDMSSLELFMAVNVNIDPYKTIEIVRNYARQHEAVLPRHNVIS